MESFETDNTLIDNILSEKILNWCKGIMHNNEEEFPYYAEYWISPGGTQMKPVTFWRPSSDIEDCLEMIKLISDKDKKLIKNINEVFVRKYFLSDINPVLICKIVLEASDIKVS